MPRNDKVLIKNACRESELTPGDNAVLGQMAKLWNDHIGTTGMVRTEDINGVGTDGHGGSTFP